MATSIPVATFGTKSEFAEALVAALLPEIEVVHAVIGVDAALAELPAIASGNVESTPSSNLGTNAAVDASARKVPKAVIYAGNIPEEEIEQVKEAVANAAPDVKNIVITKEDVEATGIAGPPSPEAIAKIVKEKLSAADI